MDKRCYVCGKIIPNGEPYYNIGSSEGYVCNKEKCFNFYFWDKLAARMLHDKWHDYAIIDRKVYEIGNDDDSPRGFNGKHWVIQFKDGMYVETHSLWFRGNLPERLQLDFPDNAKFIVN